MMSAEKFCLRWNDYESNISVAFRELREDKDFFDVTLACDDDQIQAHKVILSACSPFFRSVLQRNPHNHPLLYLKGVKYTDLLAVLNFMYHGEVNVVQEELNSFLATAEDLKVKGLTQNNSGNLPGQESTKQQPGTQTVRKKATPQLQRSQPLLAPDPIPRINTTKTLFEAEDDDVQEVIPVKREPEPHHIELEAENQQSQVEDNSMATYEDNYAEYEHFEDGAEPAYDGAEPAYGGAMVAGGNTEGNKGLEMYEEMLRSMMEKVNQGSLGSFIQCIICKRSYKSAQTTNLKNHIEAKHIDNVRFTCCVCGGIFSSRASFRTHSRNFHNEINVVLFDVSQIEQF